MALILSVIISFLLFYAGCLSCVVTYFYMLEKYCEKQGWEVVAVYQDDGFTGLNMERPDLQRMLRAIERRQINLVITKDLSRLGRNYLQTGHLIYLTEAMKVLSTLLLSDRR